MVRTITILPGTMYRSCTFRALQANEYPWELLLDADPSRELVDAYLSAGECVGAFYDQRLVGEYVAAPHSADTLELMNIAVSPHARGGGVGKQLVAECLKRGRDQGFTTLEVEPATRVSISWRSIKSAVFVSSASIAISLCATTRNRSLRTVSRVATWCVLLSSCAERSMEPTGRYLPHRLNTVTRS